MLLERINKNFAIALGPSHKRLAQGRRAEYLPDAQAQENKIQYKVSSTPNLLIIREPFDKYPLQSNKRAVAFRTRPLPYRAGSGEC